MRENYASAEQSAGKDASSNISEGKHENSAKGEKTWVIKFTIVFYVDFTMQRAAFGLAFVFSLFFFHYFIASTCACRLFLHSDKKNRKS